jgi:hypothetical protein
MNQQKQAQDLTSKGAEIKNKSVKQLFPEDVVKRLASGNYVPYGNS